METDPPDALHAPPTRMLLTGRPERAQSLRMHEAILLIGPTGSGKTPLGDVLEARGLCDTPCRHFDFGVHLRRAARGEHAGGPLDRDEIEVVRSVLQAGRLLEDEHFTIARKLLEHFLAERSGDDEALLVLNGLPRHVGQARQIDSVLLVRTLVHLDCTAETVLQRIGANAGGDRTGRSDDAAEAVRDRLARFTARTEPLIDHYRRWGATVRTIPVTATMTPKDAWEMLNRAQQRPCDSK